MVSFSVPGLILMISDCPSTLWKSRVPQLGQKLHSIRFPDGVVRTQCFTSPHNSSTSASLIHSAIPNALDAWRWHSVQWHANSVTGVPVTRYCSSPHWHFPSNGFSLETFFITCASRCRHFLKLFPKYHLATPQEYETQEYTATPSVTAFIGNPFDGRAQTACVCAPCQVLTARLNTKNS